MCTVSFIPSGNNYFFTSSRDEHAERPLADLPELYRINGHTLLFPKDPLAGGSWIAINELGHVGVLLNGAGKAHRHDPPYRKSRGLVLVDLIAQSSPVDTFENTEFKGIEPFTVILFEDKQLWSGKWDGQMKWMESLDTQKPGIWSSVTLYEPAVILKREKWFSEWLAKQTHPGTLDVIRFHQKGGDGDSSNDILMKRSDHLFTNSISTIRLSPGQASFRYLDLRAGRTAERIFPILNKISATL
jgi:hypothetical protein